MRKQKQKKIYLLAQTPRQTFSIHVVIVKYIFLPNSETVIFTELFFYTRNNEILKKSEFCIDEKLQKTEIRTLIDTYTISTAFYRYTTKFSALQTGYRSTCKTIILWSKNLMQVCWTTNLLKNALLIYLRKRFFLLFLNRSKSL